LLHGVLDQVERRRRLGNRREDRLLGQGQLAESLVEVLPRGRRDPVALVAVEVLVEIGGDDLLLALLAGVGLGQPERLDDLADLALLATAGERARRQEARPDELLGDRRAASRIAAQGVEGRRYEAADVEAGVRP